MTHKKTIQFALALAVSLVASTALALTNNNFIVNQVEVNRSGGGTVKIYLNGATTGGTSACLNSSVIGCSLSDPECPDILRVALAAQLAGRTVDFDLDSACVPGLTNTARTWNLRMD